MSISAVTTLASSSDNGLKKQMLREVFRRYDYILQRAA